MRTKMADEEQTPSSRSPDLVLKVKKATAKSGGGKMGAAWKNPDGSISLKLDPGTVLDWRMTEEGYLITLFPKD